MRVVGGGDERGTLACLGGGRSAGWCGVGRVGLTGGGRRPQQAKRRASMAR